MNFKVNFLMTKFIQIFLVFFQTVFFKLVSAYGVSDKSQNPGIFFQGGPSTEEPGNISEQILQFLNNPQRRCLGENGDKVQMHHQLCALAGLYLICSEQCQFFKKSNPVIFVPCFFKRDIDVVNISRFLQASAFNIIILK